MRGFGRIRWRLGPAGTGRCPPSRTDAWWAPCVLTLALGSCGGSETPPVSIGICGPVDTVTGFTVRDSAGVRITENLTPAAERVFGVSEEPLAVVGAREADADDVIGQLASAVLLDDGRIVVADGLTREIRVHAPDGTFLSRFGGDGSGPGEFTRTIEVFRLPGDTLVVAHEFGVRYARLLPDGSYVDGGYASGPLAVERSHALIAVFSNGDFLVTDRGPGLIRMGEPVTEVVRLGSVVRRLHGETGEIDSIGILPREDYFTFVQTGELAGATTFGALPSGRVESWAVGEDDFFLGRGDHFEIERRSEGGALTALVRICESTEPTDAAVVRRMIDEHVADMDARSEAWERAALEGIPHPTFQPAHLEMRHRTGGQLWVRDFGPDWEPRKWRIFDREGRWLTSVTLPARSRLLDLREDRLLIAVTNELGVETAQVFGLTR